METNIENVDQYVMGYRDSEEGNPPRDDMEEDYYRGYGFYYEYSEVMSARSGG